MLHMTDPDMARLLQKLDPEKSEGIAIFDKQGEWQGVLMTAQEYQLLRATAALASDADSFDRSREENAQFQNDEVSKDELMSFEEVFNGSALGSSS